MLSRPRAQTFIFLTSLMLVSASVDAKTASRARTSLSTDISPGARTCVSPEELRERISARLGYDPFTSPATKELRIKIEVRAQTFFASVEIKSATSSPRQRALTSSECQDLVDAVVLTSSLAIDPVRSMQPRPPATPRVRGHLQRAIEAGRARAKATSARRAREAASHQIQESRALAKRTSEDEAFAARRRLLSVAPSERRRGRWSIVGATATRFGDLPTIALDVGAGVEFTHPDRWRIQGALRTTLPHIYPTTLGERVTLSTQRLDLTACLAVRTFGLCALATAGIYNGSGEQGRGAIGAMAGAGARLTWDAAVWEGVTLRLAMEGLQMLTSAQWRLDQQRLYQTPWNTGSAQLLLVWSL